MILLKDGEIKSNLKGRLDILYTNLYPSEQQVAINEAISYVERAEYYKSSYCIAKANELVNALIDSADKTALLDRLNSPSYVI